MPVIALSRVRREGKPTQRVTFRLDGGTTDKINVTRGHQVISQGLRFKASRDKWFLPSRSRAETLCSQPCGR